MGGEQDIAFISRRAKHREAQRSAEVLSLRQARKIARLQGQVDDLVRRLELCAHLRKADHMISVEEEGVG